MNIQTRLYDDSDAVLARTDASQRAMKWYTADTQQNKALEYGHVMDMNTNNTLYRGTQSRYTERDDTNTALYGTAPFALRSGDNAKVDTESQLFHSQVDGYKMCDKKPLYSQTFIDETAPIRIESQRAGISTRNARILYGRES